MPGRFVNMLKPPAGEPINIDLTISQSRLPDATNLDAPAPVVLDSLSLQHSRDENRVLRLALQQMAENQRVLQETVVLLTERHHQLASRPSTHTGGRLTTVEAQLQQEMMRPLPPAPMWQYVVPRKRPFPQQQQRMQQRHAQLDVAVGPPEDHLDHCGS